MQLYNTETNQPIKTGDIVQDFRGERWVVEGSEEPHKPSSTGRVYLMSLCERKVHRTFYPSVINAEWRK